MVALGFLWVGSRAGVLGGVPETPLGVLYELKPFKMGFSGSELQLFPFPLLHRMGIIARGVQIDFLSFHFALYTQMQLTVSHRFYTFLLIVLLSRNNNVGCLSVNKPFHLGSQPSHTNFLTNEHLC